MIDYSVLDDETLAEIIPEINKGLIYYHEIDNNLVHLCGDKVYFTSSYFFRLQSCKGNRKRTVRTKQEMKEKLNESGYEFIGEL